MRSILRRYPLRVAGLVLVGIALFLSLFQLGRYPLADFDEATYGQIAQTALSSGDWMTFRYQGANWFEKPPLYLWLTAASMHAFGSSEFSIRLPSALSLVLASLFLFLLVWELSGNLWLSFFCGLSILAVQPFYFFSRQSRMDVPVIAAILCALWCFVKGNQKGKGGYFLGFGLAVATGILTKNVIGLLVIVPMASWSVFYGQWAWLKKKYFWIGVLLMIAIVAPWHIYELIRFRGDFWESYVNRHILGRGLSGPDRQAITASDYLANLWNLVQPWSALFLLFVPIAAFWNKNKELRRLAWFGLASAVSLLLFFMTAATKIWTYLLPIYPFGIVFMGAALFGFLGSISSRFGKWILCTGCAVILTVGFYNSLNDALVKLPKYFGYLQEERTIGENLKNIEQKPIFIYNWQAYTTIMFYSGKEVADLTGRTSMPDTPSYLIVPTEGIPELAARKPFHRSARFIYKGPTLSLLDLR